MESIGPWGYHLIIDARNCEHWMITDPNNIYQFTKQLVKDIDMVAYGEPQIVKFGSGNKAGYTLVQLIETSNICAHFVDENDTFYLDVFSCKEFHPQTVVNLCKQYFDCDISNKCFLVRKA